MTNILIASRNVRKKKELKTLLRDFEDIKIIDLDDLEVMPPIIVEDGRTFRQNAIKKALVMSRFFDGLVLADDSGLEVDVLDGAPGVRSARFARKKATDEENNKKLLELLKHVPEKSRHARFVCHVALAREGRLLGSHEGAVKGRISFRPKGRSGFGYDPLFVPDGYEKTFAEMASIFKNKISHRAIALRQLRESIKKYLIAP